MRNALGRWLDDRTGALQAGRAIILEPLPGGARWRSIFGPALAATFLIQFVTGLLLMTSYVPSSSQAWGSVWYIHTQMQFGWFIRGLHHWGSSGMMILLGLHLAQVVFTAGYRAPREVNWWVGLGMMMCVLGLALTGYLLPWDQKGYWAAKVATNIMGSSPVIGPYLQQVVVGGTTYGNQTVTRLYGIHVGLLPISIILLLIVHILLYYRHGQIVGPNDTRTTRAWPGKHFRNAAAASLVLAILAAWTIREGGANLDAPADPSSTDYPARPEWYFLPLFQLLNEFKPPYEIIGTHIIPGVLMAFLALLPLLDKVLPRRLLHGFACLLILGIGGAGGYLMYKAVSTDLADPDFQIARARANEVRERTLQLAEADGVPPDGAIYLLRRDPLTQGRLVLDQRCLSCHYFEGKGQIAHSKFQQSAADLAAATPGALPGALPDPVRRAIALRAPEFKASDTAPSLDTTDPLLPEGWVIQGTNARGETVSLRITPDGTRVDQHVESKQTAADLAHFGTRDWVRGLLENPSDPRYFGKVPSASGMKRWKKDSKLSQSDLDQIADFFAKHIITTPADMPASEWAELPEVQEHPAWKHFNEGGECVKCHEDWILPSTEAPSLFGWGSPAWTRRMIERPSAPHLYGYLDPADQMPGFAGRLTDGDMTTLLRLFRGEYLPPATASSEHGGTPEAPAPVQAGSPPTNSPPANAEARLAPR